MKPLTPASIDKWHAMRAIVSQHASEGPSDHTQSFKKMVVSRFLLSNFLVFFLQYSGLMMTTLIPLPSPIWFASGTACALLFLKGTRVLPGIFLASFLAYDISNTGISRAFLLAFLHASQAFLLLEISRRYIQPTLFFYQTALFAKFILCAAIMTALFSALFQLLCYPILRAPILSPMQLWLSWWLANFNGVIIFAFAIIAWDTYFPQADVFPKKALFIFTAYFLFLFIFITMLLFSEKPASTITYLFFTSLTLMMIFLRYHLFGFIFAIFLWGFLLGLSACLGAPVWSTVFSTSTLFYFQSALALIAVFGLGASVQMLKRKFDDLL